MSRVCKILKKGPQRGNNVSHANNKTKKVWNVNLHKKRLFDPSSGKWLRLRVSSRALRAINRKGLRAVLKDAGARAQGLLETRGVERGKASSEGRSK